ncbi:MAG TPA: very short patch repair endonuclease [Methylophilaceae bacterium]|nr:very short patch repair endonuclease [Methylophilaceae bacterium]
MIDRISKELRSRVMRSVKSKNTKPELFVRKVLTKLGYRYRIHARKVPGKPDIVFTKRRKVLFVHGCFWHGHKGCARGAIADSDFWRKKINANIERDERILLQLSKDDWSHLVIWECELRDMTQITAKLTLFLGPTCV